MSIQTCNFVGIPIIYETFDSVNFRFTTVACEGVKVSVHFITIPVAINKYT